MVDIEKVRRDAGPPFEEHTRQIIGDPTSRRTISQVLNYNDFQIGTVKGL